MKYQVNKVLKSGTVAANKVVRSFELGKDVDTIFDIYKNFSHQKYNAFNNCMETYRALNGVGGLRCCGSSSFAFSVAFKDDEGNYYKITKDNFYKVAV